MENLILVTGAAGGFYEGDVKQAAAGAPASTKSVEGLNPLDQANPAVRRSPLSGRQSNFLD